jgi:hypothetical protein
VTPLVGANDLFWTNRMGNALAVAGQAAATQVFNSGFWLASFLPSVTSTLVAKENAKGHTEGDQDAVCQALFVAVLIACGRWNGIVCNPNSQDTGDSLGSSSSSHGICPRVSLDSSFFLSSGFDCLGWIFCLSWYVL